MSVAHSHQHLLSGNTVATAASATASIGCEQLSYAGHSFVGGAQLPLQWHEWHYKCEGRGNMIFRYAGADTSLLGKVLRLKKTWL
jgi:hypothetical protein